MLLYDFIQRLRDPDLDVYGVRVLPIHEVRFCGTGWGNDLHMGAINGTHNPRKSPHLVETPHPSDEWMPATPFDFTVLCRYNVVYFLQKSHNGHSLITCKDVGTAVIIAKEKWGHSDGCTTLIFCTDDGCKRWWRQLHEIQWVIFSCGKQLYKRLCMSVRLSQPLWERFFTDYPDILPDD